MVKKFGGTSVGSVERIEALADRLQRERDRGQKPVVVVSAMSGETNRLVGLGDAIDASYRGPAYDMLVASGEQVSVALLTIALNKRGIQAEPLLAHQLGILTDSIHAKARIQNINTNPLRQLAEQGAVPVVAGFQGVNQSGQITTLGRGGSDTSALALAAALGLPSCEIFTDVPSVFTADPRLVPRAREIARLSFEEMMEMASLGSKVLHVRSVEIGAKHGVRIHLRSSFSEREGTWIVPEGEIVENPVVSAVTHDPSTIVLQISPVPPKTEFLAELFARLSEQGVVVDIITQSQSTLGQRLAFSVTSEDLPQTRKVLQDFAALRESRIKVIEDKAKISVVGVGMRTHPGVAARFFKVLADSDIDVHLVTTSEIKISAVIDRTRLQEAAVSLHREFDLDAI